MYKDQIQNSVICFKDVCYKYPRSDKLALEGIQLSVNEGEFLAVMGENGAGKTTLCRLVNGIIPLLTGGNLSGTVSVNGIQTSKSSVPELAVNVGMVLDDPDAQIFTSTVRAEAAFGPENILLPRQEIEERVNFSLNAVGLGGFENRAPSTLSGGEKQRLAIASALSQIDCSRIGCSRISDNEICLQQKEPSKTGKILVLDEPLCRLDPEGALEIMRVLKDIREKHGITVVMTAHNSGIMAEFADNVCILNNGQIAAIDTAKNIFTDKSLLEENGIQPPFETKKIFAGNLCNSAVKRNEAIGIRNFSYRYTNGVSVDNINLSVADNDFIAITGKNGCGKTTLFKCITGLLRPAAGDIYIRDKNIKTLSVSEISREAGFVTQNPDTQLFSDTVYNEVAFALKNMRLPKAKIKQCTEDALNMTGIKEWDAFPHALSKADRTRTVIACVLAIGCRIILFDEVDVGNDYRGGLKIMDIARDLHSRGFTIIFITHNMFLAENYARRIIKMERNGMSEL